MTDICGFVAHCGRNAGHRGHHGGFRPLSSSPLTPTETRVLAEYVHHDSVTVTAACLARSEQTIKNTLASIHRRTGTQTTVGALIAIGWLAAPELHR